MIENIIKTLKAFYLKISFACCCKSRCQIQIGRDIEINNETKDSNDNSDISTESTESNESNESNESSRIVSNI